MLQFHPEEWLAQQKLGQELSSGHSTQSSSPFVHLLFNRQMTWRLFNLFICRSPATADAAASGGGDGDASRSGGANLFNSFLTGLFPGLIRTRPLNGRRQHS